MRRAFIALVLVAGALARVSPAPAVAAGDRTVAAFGDATFAGSTTGTSLNAPLVGFAPTPTGRGYWLASSDGGVFAFGDAVFLGSAGNIRLNQPIVSMAATPTGHGYWLVARDGGVFTFGDATFRGSTGNVRLNQPIVSMAATPTGLGYWLLAGDGGLFTFGDAAFLGSAAGQRLPLPAVGMARTRTGDGYWIAARDGSVFAFGAAASYGSAPGHEPVAGIAATPTGAGYWLAGARGGVYTQGDATFAGSASAGGAIAPTDAVFAIAVTPTGRGYWLAAGAPALPPSATSGSPTVRMQARLDALGYWVPVDGRAGQPTTQALYAIEKAAGIARTGAFDATTQHALDQQVVPTPRSTSGYVVEVDKGHQLVLIVSNGRTVRAFNTSTGSGRRYRSGGGWAMAVTPEGQFHVYSQINALRISDLGELWRPKYFTGGYALHGSPSIPPTPASHGCVRLSNAAINWMWDTNAVPLGTEVLVYS
jgi:lipoprotein-anchoring transpeptidase ErfK/SrfK